MHTCGYIQHPRTTLHLTGRAPEPVMVSDGRVGLKGRIGLAITTLAGTMICGYIFAIIAWISSNFPQLVVLPIIIVGQNLRAKASGSHTAQTYQDVEAVLREALQNQQRVMAQDAVLGRLIGAVMPGDVSAAGGVGTPGRPAETHGAAGA
jgi:hypothetical protein